ncbi:MAG: right-handed parallel beta-helix repeat-containing protein, partial [Planctomycetia bacterium]|nr:right-handed parallel beta-helix repeat-containing protein [Planctomycetia bacterium]
LTQAPTADVTIGIGSSDTTEGTVSAGSLTFTTGNWSTPQTVTVTGVNDAVDDGDIAYTLVTAPATSSDLAFNGVNAADVSASNTDNDTFGITVSGISGNTTEASGTATFTVVLNSEPTDDVTIGISSNDTTEGTVSPSSLTFTNVNWNMAQTVTVTGVDDLLDDGDIMYSIVTAAATSSDGNYNGLNASDVAVTNTDNDTYNSVTVDTTSDVSDGTTISIAALLASKGADGFISLREAITATNNTANGATPDEIRFAIPITDPNYNAGRGVFTMTVNSLLPTISDAVVIDGMTQATNIGNTNLGFLGAGGTVGVDLLALSQVARPEIELVDGAAVASGLQVAANNTTIRGLALYGFTTNIFVSSGTGALIEGNIIGSAADSFADPGVGVRTEGAGIYADSADNGIVQNNLIGFNGQNGVYLWNGADGWLIENNELRGNGQITNTEDGVTAANVNNAVIQGNLVTGNVAPGIDVASGGGGSNNLVQNNTVTGNAAGLGSEQFGVRIYQWNGSGTGLATVFRNVITGNSGPGVLVHGSTSQNSISENSISANTGLGIDLGNSSSGDGVTANDALDADSGANSLQNFPVINSVATSGGFLFYNITVNSAASTTYTIRFYASASSDPSGYGEGDRYLGSTTVATGGGGTGSKMSFFAAAVTAGESPSERSAETRPKRAARRRLPSCSIPRPRTT